MKRIHNYAVAVFVQLQVYRLIGLFLLISVSLVWPHQVASQLQGSLKVPRRVRLTGTFLQVDQERQESKQYDMIVLIDHSKRYFRFDKLGTPGGGTDLDRATLERVFPPILRFVGPEKLIESIEKASIKGESVVIEGHLYTGSRILFVTGVNDTGNQSSEVSSKGVEIRTDDK